MENLLAVYCDGGARGNPGPAAAAFVVMQNGKIIHKAAKFLGKATNNFAEYVAVLSGLSWIENSQPVDITEVKFVLDSELVARQLAGVYKIKNETLRNLFFSIKAKEKAIEKKVSYTVVPRERNKLADFLVNKELDKNS